MQLYDILLKFGYERRKSQEEMFDIINNYLEEDEPFVALIEAPTGTGKSFGYLLPIIDKKQKAIISTKTKILQEQLRQDLNFLSGLSLKFLGEPIKYLILKGKSNYLCLDRFYDKQNELKQKTIINTNVDFTKHIIDLIDSNWDGDVEFTELGQDLWSEINIDDDYCDASYRKVCPYIRDCFYYSKLRLKESTSDILVVNHSLLVLKDFDKSKDRILIIDEAHELDESLVSSSTVSLSVIGISRVISQAKDMLGENANILNNIDVLSIFKDLFEDYFKSQKTNSIPLEEPFFVKDLMEKIYEPLDKARETIGKDILENLKSRLEYTEVLNSSVIEIMKSSNLFDIDYLERFTQDNGELNAFEKEIKNILFRYKNISSKISRIYNTLIYMEDKENKKILGYAINRDYSKQLKDFNYKVEAFPVFPIDVLDIGDYKGIILTSATLDEELIYTTTGIEGDYYSLSHNFDYSKVDFIIKKISPKDKELWKQAIQDSFKYLRTLHDKVLVLLTSYEQMEYIPKDDDVVFQNTVPLRLAVELIKSGDKNVLVGVDSVWTGLDVKGEKGLLISKLPFESPSNPLHYHRMKYFEKNNIDGFRYSKKKALIQFKQGFGRLVRSKEDKGTVIICDSRIWHYNEFVDFIKSLKVNIHYRQQRGE